MLTVLTGPEASEAIALLMAAAGSETGLLRSPPTVADQISLESQIMAVANAHDLTQPPELVDFLVDVLDAESLLPRLPYPFSRGERQIAGLLLAMTPPFDELILDDPTAGLDAKRRRIVVDVIAELAAEGTEIVCASDDRILLARATAES